MGLGNQHLPLRSKLCYLLSLGSLANFVYLLYACLVLWIDFGLNEEAWDKPQEQGTRPLLPWACHRAARMTTTTTL